MALFGPQTHITGRFACQTAAQAAPRHKAAHQLPIVFDARTPHAMVDVCLTTSGTSVERQNVNWFAGHVPDAAVMVGATQRAAYAAAAAQTEPWGRHRLLAIAGAAVTGALVGLAMAAAGVGIVALACVAGVTTAAATWQLFWALVLVNVAFDVSYFAALEQQGWAALHAQMHELTALCDVAARRPHLGAHAARREADEARVVQALHGTDWALQQVALELLDADAVACAQPVALVAPDQDRAAG